MEKIKFAAKVLLFVTAIPVIFITTLSGNNARLQERKSKEHVKTARLIISCGVRNIYVKK